LSLYSFTHSPSFSFDEWIYIGVSFFRTNRIEDLYDIHIVSKTLSGVENQDSFVSQELNLDKTINSSSSKNEIPGLEMNVLMIGSFRSFRKYFLEFF